MNKFISRLYRKVTCLGVAPLHVFVFHHVSSQRNPKICAEQDWTSSEAFFSNLLCLQKEYHFISLESAYRILSETRLFRRDRFAVLTTDDGLRTVPNVLPWLEQQGIPLTCFVNAKYLDGKSYKECDKIRILKEDPQADVTSIIRQQYMDEKMLFNLDSPLLSIGSHGYEHLDATALSRTDFITDVERCNHILKDHPRYIPFYAYPWGKHSLMTDGVLKELGMVPVLVDGIANYNDSSFIHRECIDSLSFE